MRSSTVLFSKTSKNRDSLLNVEKICRDSGYILCIRSKVKIFKIRSVSPFTLKIKLGNEYFLSQTSGLLDFLVIQKYLDFYRDLEIFRPPDLLLLTVNLQKHVFGCRFLVNSVFVCFFCVCVSKEDTSKNILPLAKSIYWPFIFIPDTYLKHSRRENVFNFSIFFYSFYRYHGVRGVTKTIIANPPDFYYIFHQKDFKNSSNCLKNIQNIQNLTAKT